MYVGVSVGDGVGSGAGGGWGKDRGYRVDAGPGVCSAQGQSSFEPEGLGVNGGDGVETSRERDFGRRDDGHRHRGADGRIVGNAIDNGRLTMDNDLVAVGRSVGENGTVCALDHAVYHPLKHGIRAAVYGHGR